MTKTEDLMKKIAKIVLGETQSFPKAMGDRWKANEKAAKILATCQEAGLAFVVKGELPNFDPPFHIKGTAAELVAADWHRKTIEDMLKAGFRQTEEIELT